MDTEILSDRLSLSRLGETRFESAAQSSAPGAIFGGQLIAQTLLAAYETVESRPCHALQCMFILPGDPTRPIIFDVDHVRDGSAFATRYVTARQRDRPIFTLSASFHVPEVGLDHQLEMPPTTPWGDLIDDRDNERGRPAGLTAEQAGHWFSSTAPIEIRTVGSALYGSRASSAATSHLWMRAREPIGGGAKMQHAAMAYASDLGMIFTAMRPHNVSWVDPGFVGASLNHAMWFHRPADFNSWHLYVQDSPTAFGGRALTHGAFYDEAGLLIASTAQETLIRPPPGAGSRTREEFGGCDEA